MSKTLSHISKEATVTHQKIKMTNVVGLVMTVAMSDELCGASETLDKLVNGHAAQSSVR